MRDPSYLKDDQIKEFIEHIFYAYRETYSDPRKILKKNSFGTAHHRALHLIERNNGITISCSSLLRFSFCCSIPQSKASHALLYKYS